MAAVPMYVKRTFRVLYIPGAQPGGVGELYAPSNSNNARLRSIPPA